MTVPSDPPAADATLHDWLQWLEAHHPPGAIRPGLERVRAVAGALALPRPATTVITVGGTNGKGSTVAFVEAIARAAGLRTGAYTSPHLLRYNERVRIDGREATDAALVEALAAVEAARAPDITLTYFEYGTLAALWLFAHAQLDVAVLEVGLGGRLDAVNLVDADVAVITTVDLDHQDWLGSDRETIGREKAGIARAFKPLILGEDDPPASVLRHAYAIGASAIRAGCDYRFAPIDATHWRWEDVAGELVLPMPSLTGAVQLRNAAAAITALQASSTAIPADAWAQGVATARLPGRLQRHERGGIPIVLDVGHNPQAAQQLAQWLAAMPAPGRTLAVYAALADKDAAAVTAALAPQVQQWHLAGLQAGTRSQTAQALAQRLPAALAGQVGLHGDVASAMQAALQQAGPGDRVLVFGSFHTVAEALIWLDGTPA